MQKRSSTLILAVCLIFGHFVTNAQKFQWVHQYVGPSSSVSEINYDNEAGFYICGQARPSLNLFDSVPVYYFGYEDGFVLKADTTSGDIEWIHNIGSGGSLESTINIARFNDKILISGYTQYGLIVDTLAISNNGGDHYIASFDTTGPFNWLTPKQIVSDLDVDITGTIYFSGIWQQYTGSQYNYQLYRMSSTGVVTDSLYLFSSNNGYSNKLICDQKGHIILTQYFPDSITFLGSTYYGNPNQLPYTYDYLMLECDTMLNVLSVKQLSSPGSNFVYDMILDNQGMIKTIAQWQDTVIFDGTVIPGSGNRMTIATFDTSLTLINHTDLNLSCSCSAKIVENDLGEFFLGLNFTNYVVIDNDTINSGYTMYPGDGMVAKLNGNQVGWYRMVSTDSLSSGGATVILSKPNGNKLYVAGTMSPHSVVIDTFTFNFNGKNVYTALLIDTTYGLFTGISALNQEMSSEITIVPNPSSGNFNIHFGNKIENGKIDMMNIFGEKVYSEKIINEPGKEISVENISPGIYFVNVFDGEKSYCNKIIILKE